jgi:hypothetical protein
MGGVLGWFTPKVAAAAKPDPLAQAIKQRESNLEAVAIKRLGEDAGKQWLDSPHAALGRKTPRAAAADVNGFEQAFALLQAPQAMAG